MQDSFILKYRIEGRKCRFREFDQITVRATSRHSALIKFLNYVCDNDIVVSWIIIKPETKPAL